MSTTSPPTPPLQLPLLQPQQRRFSIQRNELDFYILLWLLVFIQDNHNHYNNDHHNNHYDDNHHIYHYYYHYHHHGMYINQEVSWIFSLDHHHNIHDDYYYHHHYHLVQAEEISQTKTSTNGRGCSYARTTESLLQKAESCQVHLNILEARALQRVHYRDRASPSASS